MPQNIREVSIREELISGSKRVTQSPHQRIVRWLAGLDLASSSSPAALLPVTTSPSVLPSASSVPFVALSPCHRRFKTFGALAPASKFKPASFVAAAAPNTRPQFKTCGALALASKFKKTSPTAFPSTLSFVAPPVVYDSTSFSIQTPLPKHAVACQVSSSPAPSSPAPASTASSSSSSTPTLDRILGQLNDLVRPQEQSDSFHGTIYSTDTEEELTVYTNTDASGLTWDTQNASHLTDLGPPPSPCIRFHFDPTAPSPHTPVLVKRRRRTVKPVPFKLPAPTVNVAALDDTDEFLHQASYLSDPFVDTVEDLEFATLRKGLKPDSTLEDITSVQPVAAITPSASETDSFHTNPFNETVDTAELAEIREDAQVYVQMDDSMSDCSDSTHFADIAFIMDSDTDSSVDEMFDDECSGYDGDTSNDKVVYNTIPRQALLQEAEQDLYTPLPAPVALAASTHSSAGFGWRDIVSPTTLITVGVTAAAAALFALSRWA